MTETLLSAFSAIHIKKNIIKSKNVNLNIKS